MHYNMKNILGTTALALVFGLLAIHNSTAQGVVSLTDDVPALDTEAKPETQPEADPFLMNENVPDELSLTTEDPLAEKSGVITPPASNTFGLDTTNHDPLQAGLPMQEGNMPNNTPNNMPALNDNNSNLSDFSEEELEIEAPINPIANQDDNLIEGIDNKLFNQMSELEKQTALLTLELRREKIRNDIEAIKNQRAKAKQEEADKIEEKRKKQEEWKTEQDKKLLVEQQKLREIEIKMEKLRQEKLLKSYKGKMLDERQKWINGNAEIYKKIAQEKTDKQSIIDDLKTKLTFLGEQADRVTQRAAEVKESHAREISELQTQISILKSRLEAEEKANPFADAATVQTKASEEEVLKLSDIYAVMEIRGKGSNLIAKLINKDGKSFFAQAGTALQTGHVVDEITQTYVRADKGGLKEYIYFSAGGILDKEPASGVESSLKDEMGKLEGQEKKNTTRSLLTSSGIPGISQDMTVR